MIGMTTKLESRPNLGLLDGRDYLVLGPSLLHHPLDEHAKAVCLRGCGHGSHLRFLSRCLQGGGNADHRASEPGPESGVSTGSVASTASHQSV
jgi:hypothetical protein